MPDSPDFNSTDLESWDDLHQQGFFGLGPSDVGRCIRQAGYRQAKVTPSDLRSRDQARLGSLLHLGYAALVASLKNPQRRPEVEIEIPGLRRPGHADDVDYRRYIVTDLKTVSGRAYPRYLNYGPPEHMWDQAEVYAYGLHLQGNSDIDWTLRILLFNRETGQENEFMRDADYEHGRKVVEDLIERQIEIDQATEPDLLPREGAGPGRGFPCDYCDWMSRCWPEGEQDRSPQAETIADDPDAIGQVLADYLAVSEPLSKLEDAKKDARAFLTGLPAGTYGGYTLSWQGGRDLDPEPDPEAMEELLMENGLPVPTRPRRSALSIRVNRVKPAATVGPGRGTPSPPVAHGAGGHVTD